MRPHHTRSAGTATYIWHPSYGNPTIITEGTTYTYYVQTTNVPNGTTLYWSITHGTTNSSDFSANSGSFTVNSNIGSFNISPISDGVNDGGETFTLNVRTESTSGPIVLTRSIVLDNTPPYWNTWYYTSNMKETSAYDYGINIELYNHPTTTNVTVYWAINHITTDNNDFNPTNGQTTLYWNGQYHYGFFQFNVVNDFVSEGTEYFNVILYTDCLYCTQVHTTSTLQVIDPSACTNSNIFQYQPTHGPAVDPYYFYSDPNYSGYDGQGYIFYYQYFIYVNEFTDQYYYSSSGSPTCSTLADGWFIDDVYSIGYGTAYAKEFSSGSYTGNTVSFSVSNYILSP